MSARLAATSASPLTTTLDLSFAPAVPRYLKRLTRDEIAHYNKEGFVQPFRIFPTAEVAAIRDGIDRQMARLGEDGAYGINCYQARLSSLWDIATDPRILDHVEDIIGENIVCWASAILSKPARDGRQVPWHQVASFWKLSPARTVTVWRAIDDADEGNSAMRFLPRTHTEGPLATGQTTSASVFHKETVGADSMGKPFTNVLKAGEISLHADMLVHGSLPNRSDRRRCGLTLRYCPPEVAITDPAWARGVEAIICRGKDPYGRWKHHERPQNDDILATSSPHVVGNN